MERREFDEDEFQQKMFDSWNGDKNVFRVDVLGLSIPTCDVDVQKAGQEVTYIGLPVVEDTRVPFQNEHAPVTLRIILPYITRDNETVFIKVLEISGTDSEILRDLKALRDIINSSDPEEKKGLMNDFLEGDRIDMREISENEVYQYLAEYAKHFPEEDTE